MTESKNTAERNEKGQFQKGASGNPAGRPKKPITAKEYGIAAYARIADIAANSENEKMRFDANKWLAEMAFGKPTQAAEIEGNMSAGTIKVEFGDTLSEWAK